MPARLEGKPDFVPLGHFDLRDVAEQNPELRVPFLDQGLEGEGNVLRGDRRAVVNRASGRSRNATQPPASGISISLATSP